MNRRAFLGTLGAVVALPAVPAPTPIDDSRISEYTRAFFARGVMSPDEVRALEDLKPIHEESK